MRYTFIAARDLYEPPRGYITGTVETGQGFEGKSDILRLNEKIDNAEKCGYILDFGDRVEVRFVSGWGARNATLYLQPFPLSQGIRPDNGRPIDMSGWMLGPCRTFHLKLKVADDGTA